MSIFQMNLTVEQLQDVMHAMRYYQYHHISINNPRFEEFSNILTLLADEIKDANLSRYSECGGRSKALPDWLD